MSEEISHIRLDSDCWNWGELGNEFEDGLGLGL